MKESAPQEYSAKFKARIALQAIGKQEIEALSDKHTIPKDTIRHWAEHLEKKATVAFSNSPSPASTGSVKVQDDVFLLRTTLEGSPNGVLVTDRNQDIVTYNQKCVDMWNIPEGMAIVDNMDVLMEFILEQVKNPQKFKTDVEALYNDLESEVQNIVELKDGRFFERYSVPYIRGNEIVGRVINFTDVTTFKETEAKLTKYGNLIQSINANVKDAILRSTPNDGLLYVNDAFLDLFGASSKEEVLGTPPPNFYAESQTRWDLLNELKKKGALISREVLYKRKDGSTFWGLENSTLVESEEGIFIDAVVTDIDSRKKAEEELRKSEEKYRNILKNMEEGYFETSLKGEVTFFNTQLVEMLGYSATDFIGMHYTNFMDEKSAENVYQTFNEVYKTGKAEESLVGKLMRHDHSLVDVEASVTLRMGENSTPIGFSGIIRNVTDRNRKERQIRNSLKEKEVLLAEIHHRVKNNLAIISGLLYLQADKTEDDRAQKALMQSQNRINSMALIHELLYDNQTFSSLNPRAYINQLVEHISANLRGKDSQIKTEIEAENFDLEMSTAIPCALIINELITNAHKYAFNDEAEGTIRVRFLRTADDYYQLSVADTGCGLPANFSLEDNSRYSLGISLVKTLAQQLGGSLSIINEKGAEFLVTFPASQHT